MRTHMTSTAFTLMLALVVVLVWPVSLRAQNATSELRVATYVFPPFVIKRGDRLTGFSIELWEEVAARLHVKSSYQIAPDTASCIESVRANNADIGVSGIFYTSERDRVIDYSYPILNTGLQVMVRDTKGGLPVRPLQDWFHLLFSSSALLWLAAALVVIVIPAHVVWLLDRRNEDGISPTTRYFPGIFHSMFWAATGLVSQIQVLPRNWLARTFAVLWMFSGVVFIALYTAQLTALLTAEEIRGAINGPDDLPGKRVGTLVSSTSTIYLRGINADVQELASTDQMYQALLDGKVDAVVLGAAALRYYASHEGRGLVKLVGLEFDKNDVGFVVQLGSSLRKRVSNELLALHEDGTYGRIRAKWFGSE